ncbi:hypothetical protein Tco_0871764 [Tanacetum coccineum]
MPDVSPYLNFQPVYYGACGKCHKHASFLFGLTSAICERLRSRMLHMKGCLLFFPWSDMLHSCHGFEAPMAIMGDDDIPRVVTS